MPGHYRKVIIRCLQKKVEGNLNQEIGIYLIGMITQVITSSIMHPGELGLIKEALILGEIGLDV